MTRTIDQNPTKINSFRHFISRHRIMSTLIIAAMLAVVLPGALITWTLYSLLSGPDPMAVSEFHPFRSAEAKQEYLAFDSALAHRWPVASRDSIVETSFGRTFMRISGPTDAPPLVLLPGGGSSSLIWAENVGALSRDYRTYALDNIYDFGRSVYTRPIANGREFAAWLDELFDSLALGSDIGLMGYSYGGWVAGQYALCYPERLSRLVLIAPAATVLPIADEFIWRMVATLVPVRWTTKKTICWVWNDLAEQGDSGKAIVERRIDYVRMAYRCFTFKQPVNPTVLSDAELGGLRMPVLYLIGENETGYDAARAVDRLHRAAPGITTQTITGTGHDLMYTHAGPVNDTLLAFLND